MILIDAAEEIDSRFNALGVLAGNARKPAALHAYRNEERLIAPAAELFDGHVLSDLHAEFEFDAHFADNVYLGGHYVLFKTV